jgi:hypothetical protein
VTSSYPATLTTSRCPFGQVKLINPPPAHFSQKCIRHCRQNHIINFRSPQKLQAGDATCFPPSTLRAICIGAQRSKVSGGNRAVCGYRPLDRRVMRHSAISWCSTRSSVLPGNYVHPLPNLIPLDDKGRSALSRRRNGSHLAAVDSSAGDSHVLTRQCRHTRTPCGSAILYWSLQDHKSH